MNTPALPLPAIESPSLWLGTLAQLLRFEETGCQHAAQRAADLLGRLADQPDLEPDFRDLCERAAHRLEDTSAGEQHMSRP